MRKGVLKKAVCRSIDKNREKIIGCAKEVASKPELGFKEFRASQLIRSIFSEMGLHIREGIALTGVEGALECSRPGPSLLLMGEMDSVVERESPIADPVTGAAHLCGHYLQVGIMLGAAVGLTYAGVGESLSGRIVFLGTPAEEFIEIHERLRMKDEGKIHYLGGKQELVRLGYLETVDMAMLIHAHSQLPERKILFGASRIGFQAKFIQFRGKASHAGATPHEGINALNAACLAMMNIHAQRETFRDEDSIRVHPVITKGGDVVNVVPADVRMETYVRGCRTEAIADASAKVDRAVRAGADAVGAQVAIRNVPGYLPLVQNKLMTAIARKNAVSLAGEGAVGEAGFQGGSTDMGDLSHFLFLRSSFTPEVLAAYSMGQTSRWWIMRPPLFFQQK
mgnify:CR=1 FL=1